MKKKIELIGWVLTFVLFVFFTLNDLFTTNFTSQTDQQQAASTGSIIGILVLLAITIYLGKRTFKEFRGLKNKRDLVG